MNAQLANAQLAAAATQSQEVMMDLRGVVYRELTTADLYTHKAQVIFDHADGNPYFEELAAEVYAIGLAHEDAVEDLSEVLEAAERNCFRQECWGGVSVR